MQAVVPAPAGAQTGRRRLGMESMGWMRTCCVVVLTAARARLLQAALHAEQEWACGAGPHGTWRAYVWHMGYVWLQVPGPSPCPGLVFLLFTLPSTRRSSGTRKAVEEAHMVRPTRPPVAVPRGMQP